MSRFIGRRTFSITVMAIMISMLLSPCTRVYAATEAPTKEQLVVAPESIGQRAGGPVLEEFMNLASRKSSLSADTIAEGDIDVLIAATKDILSDSFEDNYSIEVSDSNLITISIWADGIAYASVYAMQDKGYRDDWDSLLNSLEGMAKMVYEVYEPYGYSVAINVLNDLNKDNVLISYMNGVLIYDTVTEVDL